MCLNRERVLRAGKIVVVETVILPSEGAPFRCLSYPCFPVPPPVAFTVQSLISHAGLSVLTGFMDALGFGRLCEDRLGQFVPAGASPRPGRLLGSLAAMLAAGGEHVSDLDMLRAWPGVFNQLPSNATVSRFFERTVRNPEPRTVRLRLRNADPPASVQGMGGGRTTEPGTAGDGRGPAGHRPERHIGDLPLGQGTGRRHPQGRLRFRPVHCLLRPLHEQRYRRDSRCPAAAGQRAGEQRR